MVQSAMLADGGNRVSQKKRDFLGHPKLSSADAAVCKKEGRFGQKRLRSRW